MRGIILMNNLIKTIFAVMCFSIVGNALAMNPGKREREEQVGPYTAVRSARGPEYHSLVANLESNFQHALERQALEREAETESVEDVILTKRLAAMKDAVISNELNVLDENSLEDKLVNFDNYMAFILVRISRK